MNPAFFAPQLRTFIPLFLNEALKVRHLIDPNVYLLIHRSLQLAQKWKDEVISLHPTGQPVINITTWLSRAALDIIGEGQSCAVPL
jgi:hypothetical protein